MIDENVEVRLLLVIYARDDVPLSIVHCKLCCLVMCLKE
jgi:hypothetical protein